ncbi:hypothetical protein QBC37DRAFT_452985 [Rhypophila decipiens]|uniref:Uncharacterized protein n=1 Tax=Rhypophila decipiens TaxID=261697 RepID=A0AAN6YCM5_9PEZI|nr:hypothetical protein QBC37DRAFT_452985 [Rhypophila decipiens]
MYGGIKMFTSWCLRYLVILLGLAALALGQISSDSNNPGPNRPAAATSTMLKTVTRTSAITVVSGSPVTGIIDFSTTTSTITIINPTSTTFVTVTVTPSPQLLELGNEAVPRVTSTVTTILLTTAFTPPVSLRTRVVTELTLTTLAGVTVTVTITIGVPSPTRDVTTSISSTVSSTATTETETGGPISSTATPIPSSSVRTTQSISTIRTSARTSITTSTENTMMTMMTPSSSSSSSSTTSQTPTSTPQPVPIPPPPGTFTQEMDRTRLAGIIISSILLALLLAFATFWFIRRRRRRQRFINELILPRTGGSAGVVGAMRTNSSRGRTGVLGPRITRRVSIRHDPLAARGRPTTPSRDAVVVAGDGSPDSSGGSGSGLTGEGEVRIVIRPAPRNRRTASSHIFPMPPGQPPLSGGGYTYYGGDGQNPNMFVVEETTTRETTPENNPDQWSIVSDQGSRGTNEVPAAAASSSGGRPSGFTTGTGTGTTGRESSYPLVTVLSPTPVAARGSTGRNNTAPPWQQGETRRTPPRPPRTNNDDGSSGSGQRSARSGRTDRSGGGSSTGRAILGGSSRFPNMF